MGLWLGMPMRQTFKKTASLIIVPIFGFKIYWELGAALSLEGVGDVFPSSL